MNRSDMKSELRSQSAGELKDASSHRTIMLIPITSSPSPWRCDIILLGHWLQKRLSFYFSHYIWALLYFIDLCKYSAVYNFDNLCVICRRNWIPTKAAEFSASLGWGESGGCELREVDGGWEQSPEAGGEVAPEGKPPSSPRGSLGEGVAVWPIGSPGWSSGESVTSTISGS